MRGARAGQDKAPHLLAAMICGARAVLAQKDVDQKTNEITQVRPLLDGLDITGALVTADACTCRRRPPGTWRKTRHYSSNGSSASRTAATHLSRRRLGITSRSADRGGTPEAIAIAARRHYDIEALHHVRDTTMHGGAQRLRSGSSAQVIAAVHNTGIAVLRLCGFTGTAAGRRWAARNPARTIAALGLTYLGYSR